MPQQLGNLIFDRTELDVAELQAVTAKLVAGTATQEERAAFLEGMKGAYNYTDLNRVGAAVEYLTALLASLGYYVNTKPLNIVVGEKPGRLPSGYKELEYIQSTGSQYLDTGVKPNGSTRVTLEVESTVDGTFPFFGCRDSSASKKFILWQISSTQIRVDYGNSRTTYDVGTTNEKTLADINKNTGFFGSVQLYTEPVSFEGSYSILVLGQNTGGSVDTRKLSAKLYSFSVYDGENLIRELIPCINSDGAVGMYDLAQGAFYGNSGSGTFLPGPYVEPGVITRDYWLESDIQTPVQMAQYLANIVALRDRLPYVAPDAPVSMEGLTYQEANDIEEILYTLEDVLEAMQAAFLTRQANTLFMIAGGVFNNV